MAKGLLEDALGLESYDAPSPAYFPPDRSYGDLVSLFRKAMAEGGFASGFRPSENVIDRRPPLTSRR
jgi:hypothetical protein